MPDLFPGRPKKWRAQVLRPEPSDGRGGAGYPPQPLSRRCLLHRLAMQGEIETFALHVLGDAQPDDRIENLEDDQRDDSIVDEHDGDAFDLVDHLAGVAFE